MTSQLYSRTDQRPQKVLKWPLLLLWRDKLHILKDISVRWPTCILIVASFSTSGSVLFRYYINFSWRAYDPHQSVKISIFLRESQNER